MAYSDLKQLLMDAKDFAEGANDLQLKSKLLDIQSGVFDLQEENRDLRLKLEELTNNEELNKRIELKREHYYLNEDGPYCTNCWDANRILIRVLKAPRPMQRVGQYRCPNCETFTN